MITYCGKKNTKYQPWRGNKSKCGFVYYFIINKTLYPQFIIIIVSYHIFNTYSVLSIYHVTSFNPLIHYDPKYKNYFLIFKSQ